MNEAFDRGDVGFFNVTNGEEFIKECFKSVIIQNANKMSYMAENHEFQQMIREEIGNDFEWPSSSRLSNSFKYIYEQYIDNVKTNLNTHCEKRLKKFFSMIAYYRNDLILDQNQQNPNRFTKIDISNAVNYAYAGKDSTRADEQAQYKLAILLNELRAIGVQDPFNFEQFVADHWFKSLHVWLTIQRLIESFHDQYGGLRQSWVYHRMAPQNVTRPPRPEPPNITQFVAIPMCSFQRRHIKIDTTTLYNILCEIEEVPLKLGAEVKETVTRKRARKKEIHYCRYNGTKFRLINTKQNEFLANKSASWALYFDMDIINRLVKFKKPFGNSIITDGVSCSVLFSQPLDYAENRDFLDIDAETVRDLYEQGVFTSEMGIDPNMRTYIAAVRRDMATEEEVSILVIFGLVSFHSIICSCG